MGPNLPTGPRARPGPLAHWAQAHCAQGPNMKPFCMPKQPRWVASIWHKLDSVFDPIFVQGPQTGFLMIFGRFFGVLGSGSGLKMLLGPVRSFSRSRFLISSILDPFRLNFDILGRPQYCVFLQDREYSSSSATRQFSPNPSYLRSGELVLPWDTKNRSSHTQIIHIEFLRAQMYLKSAKTESTPPSEHMDIFAENTLLAPRGVWEAQCVKTLVVFQPKWRERPFRVDETTPSVTKSAACAQKLMGAPGDGFASHPPGP